MPAGLAFGTESETPSAGGIKQRGGRHRRPQAPLLLEWRYTEGVGGGWSLEEAGSSVCMTTLSPAYERKPAWLNRLTSRLFFRSIAEDLLSRSMQP
jgi:hypothetical protein